MFVLQNEMTKHHYGLPKKEQINLPKNVTPPRKTNTCLPKNGLFQHGLYTSSNHWKSQETKNHFFSFKGPQHTFRPSRALKTVGNHTWFTERSSSCTPKRPPHLEAWSNDILALDLGRINHGTYIPRNGPVGFGPRWTSRMGFPSGHRHCR